MIPKINCLFFCQGLLTTVESLRLCVPVVKVLLKEMVALGSLPSSSDQIIRAQHTVTPSTLISMDRYLQYYIMCAHK